MKSLKPIFGIMAVGPEGIVGKGNALPWDCPEDLEYFRAQTTGQVVIMGRKTYDGIPEIFFAKREAIVLSRNPQFKPASVKVARSLDESIEIACRIAGARKIFMIGGADVAKQFLDAGWLSGFYLTKIALACEGDVKLDTASLSGWKDTQIKAGNGYSIHALKNPVVP